MLSLSTFFLLFVWFASCVITAVLATISFGSSNWLHASGSRPMESGMANIEMGLLFACFDFHNSTTNVCGRYGAGLADVPTMSLRSSAFFYGFGLFVSWTVIAASLFLFCFPHIFRYVSAAVVFSAVLYTIALLCYGGGLGELSSSSGTPVFSMCNGAKPFSPGECTIAPASVVGKRDPCPLTAAHARIGVLTTCGAAVSGVLGMLISRKHMALGDDA